MNLCINCKWYEKTPYMILCRSPRNASPVDGSKLDIHCWDMRLPTGGCGPEGRLFEGRFPKTEPVSELGLFKGS